MPKAFRVGGNMQSTVAGCVANRRLDSRLPATPVPGMSGRGHPGLVNTFRAFSVAARQWQPSMWSLTMPIACMKA